MNSPLSARGTHLEERWQILGKKRWTSFRGSDRQTKNWLLVCWWWRFHWSFAHLIAPVVTTHHLHHP